MSLPISRPLLVVLLAAVALGAVMLVGRGGGGGEEAAEPVAPAIEQPATTPPPGAELPAPSKTAEPVGPPRDVPGRNKPDPNPSRERTLPAGVERAIAGKKVVVLLLWNPRGVDDRAVKNAVDGIPRRGGDVRVFTDRTKNVARYSRITAAADVTDTPTLIVVDRNEESRKVTGYLDPVTVQQYVVDALRGAP